MPNNKINSAVANSFKFLANLRDDQTSDPSYIPENMQPFINSFVRNSRKQFDALDKYMSGLDKNSDDYIAANREIEKIAKSFITLRNQIDKFKVSQGNFKNQASNINQGTKEENMHINSVIFGEQMDEFVIGEDGRMNFGIKGTPQKYYKLDTLQDDFPLVAEPFNAKSYVLQKYEETLMNKRLGKLFNRDVEYNKTLYKIRQGGNSEAIGLAYTDLVGDSSTESFAEMWESGLADESLYINPETGEKLPKDSSWMKDEDNSEILSQLVAKHITNAMEEASGAFIQPEVTVSDDKGATIDDFDETITLTHALPAVTISDTKVDKKPKKNIDEEVDDYLKPDLVTQPGQMKQMIKTMPPRLFDRYMKRLENQFKKSKNKDKKSKKEWEKFLNTLPGGDYYKLMKNMKDWRKSKLTPSQLIKKYS